MTDKEFVDKFRQDNNLCWMARGYDAKKNHWVGVLKTRNSRYMDGEFSELYYVGVGKTEDDIYKDLRQQEIDAKDLRQQQAAFVASGKRKLTF